MYATQKKAVLAANSSLASRRPTGLTNVAFDQRGRTSMPATPRQITDASRPALRRLCLRVSEPGLHHRLAQHQPDAAAERDRPDLGDAVRQNPGPHLGIDASLVMNRDEHAQHHAVKIIKNTVGTPASSPAAIASKPTLRLF